MAQFLFYYAFIKVGLKRLELIKSLNNVHCHEVQGTKDLTMLKLYASDIVEKSSKNSSLHSMVKSSNTEKTLSKQSNKLSNSIGFEHLNQHKYEASIGDLY